MIFTVGHKANYLAAIEKYGKIKKALGGSVFKTYEDAERAITNESKVGIYDVFGVAADWETDTVQNKTHQWHDLLIGAEIIVLEQAQ